MTKQIVKDSLGNKLIDNSDILNKRWNNTNNSDSGPRGVFGDNRPIGNEKKENNLKDVDIS